MCWATLKLVPGEKAEGMHTETAWNRVSMGSTPALFSSH